MEEWRRFECDYPLYVSSLGRVKTPRGIRKNVYRPDGYCEFKFKKNGKRLGTTLHRAVALAFGIVGPNDWVNHKDGVKSNNTLENLEKSDPLHNNRHARSLGLYESRSGSKANNTRITINQAKKVISLYAEGVPIIEIARSCGVSRPYVSNLALGNRWPELNWYREEMQIKRRHTKPFRRGKSNAS